jgi:acetylornithine deacetylase/succinyl-diaminopimelate desuccinylase-like protein
VPVLKDDKLYGRGGADDGYAICSALTAVMALQQAGIPHGRIVITIEGSEESGSPDLMHYMDKCKAQIGDIGLVICLDSGAFTYDRMWLTGSLRGVIGGILTVETITEPMHSGLGGGVCPCPFRIARSLLDRIEDPYTGIVKLGDLYCPVQPDALAGFKKLDEVGHDIFVKQFPIPAGLEPEISSKDQTGLLIRNNWQPCLTVTGIDGFPTTAKAGNVIRHKTSMKISVRLPPNVDCDAATQSVQRVLEANPPYGAKVTFKADKGGNGWAAKPLQPWLGQAVDNGSKMFFGSDSGYSAIGGSIPFMKMLGDMYPVSQFVITGVLGPKSNAHGPNEFLHVPFAKKLTCAVAKIVAEQFKNLRKI